MLEVALIIGGALVLIVLVLSVATRGSSNRAHEDRLDISGQALAPAADMPKRSPMDLSRIGCGVCRERAISEFFDDHSYNAAVQEWKGMARRSLSAAIFERILVSKQQKYPRTAELYLYQEMVYEFDTERQLAGARRQVELSTVYFEE